MNLDFLGAEQNFTQLVGSQPEWVLDFQYDDGRALAVDDVFFSGVVVLPDGVITGLDVEQDSSATGRVVFRFPRLMEGVYSYELMADGEDGSRLRMAYGRLGVHRTNLELGDQLMEEYEEALNSERRLVTVRLPKGMAERCVLAWRGSSAAMVAAEKALDAARRAEAAAEKLDAVDATMEQLDAQVQEFRVFVAQWKDEAASLLVMNPVTGTIWVGNFDTGQPYQGEPGKAPRINAYGFWETYEDGQWVTLPYCAIGKDGLDGDQVRRFLIGSVSELPAGGERGVLYYVPRAAGGYDMWAWLENAGWVCVGTDPYGVATTHSLGLVMISTDVEVENGAPVGLNSAKQLMIPMATSSVPGALKPSSDVVSDRGAGTHFSVSGNLLGDVATVASFGGVKVSTATVLTEGGIIGMNSDGQLLVRLATPYQAGAVLPGSRFEQLENIPYLVAVGVDGIGRLANCLVRGGALQHRQPKDWAGEWIEDGAFPTKDAHYLGLVISAQFWQSREVGLELLPATTERLAGVYLATGVDDERSAAVLNARQAKAAFPGKGDVYDKAAADERYMRRSGTTHTVVTCTPDEMAAIAAAGRDKNTLYIVANRRGQV